MVWEEKIFDLAGIRDSTLIGTIGELIAWRYLRKVTGCLPMWFGAGQYFYPQYPTRTGKKYEISGLDEFQIEFLKNMSRRYDFICCKYRYRSRYYKRRIEEVTADLRSAIQEKDEEEIEDKERELNRVLKKGRVVHIYVVEVKATVKGRRHNMKEGAKGMRRKLPKDIKKAKSLGFKPLLVIVEFLDSWKFKVICRQL